MKTQICKPFLKWAGGKSRALPYILPHLPKGRRLIEPFVGSGAVFLNTDYEEYLLCDTNQDLINLYEGIKRDPEIILGLAYPCFSGGNNAEVYYGIRDFLNESFRVGSVAAAYFIYLNKHCFNGLCRYNKKGEFNVPFGKYKSPTLPEKEILFFAEKAKKAEFRLMDFEETFKLAEKGDVIYCDPPYVSQNDSNSNFNYGAKPFGDAEQTRLAELAEDAAQQGIDVIISNHNTLVTRYMYKNASHLEFFDVKRSISCKGDKRQDAQELLAIYEAKV